MFNFVSIQIDFGDTTSDSFRLSSMVQSSSFVPVSSTISRIVSFPSSMSASNGHTIVIPSIPQSSTETYGSSLMDITPENNHLVSATLSSFAAFWSSASMSQLKTPSSSHFSDKVTNIALVSTIGGISIAVFLLIFTYLIIRKSNHVPSP